MESIYLDYNATTPLHPVVKEVLTETMDIFGNPASAHEFGQEAERITVESKEKVAAFLGADPEELIFTSGGTESNNSVLFQLLTEKLSGKEPRKLICSSIEHSSILEYSTFLKNNGIEVHYLPVDKKGFISIKALRNVITPKSLVSIIYANNETGTIQDIEAIAKIVKEAGAELHVDATQAVGKIPINLSELPIDFLTASAHKIYGPRGIGLLYKRRFTKFTPLIIGGGQQNEQRAGTENQLLMAGFAAAIVQRKEEMNNEFERLFQLKQKLIEAVQHEIPSARFNGPLDRNALPGTVSITFPGVGNEMLLLYLDMAGIAISTGSACSSRSFKASHVLHSIGLSELEAFQTVRVSMGKDTSAENVERFVKELSNIVGRLKK